jgi:hypothetical protein
MVAELGDLGVDPVGGNLLLAVELLLPRGVQSIHDGARVVGELAPQDPEALPGHLPDIVFFVADQRLTGSGTTVRA